MEGKAVQFDIGDSLVSRRDQLVTARVVDARIMNGIQHYRLSVLPRGITSDTCWLSAYGVAIDFRKEATD